MATLLEPATGKTKASISTQNGPQNQDVSGGLPISAEQSVAVLRGVLGSYPQTEQLGAALDVNPSVVRVSMQPSALS